MSDDSDFLYCSSDFAENEEKNVIALECWQDIRICDIWLPSRLLPSRKKQLNTRLTKGIFHTLTREPTNCIESFSTYSDSEEETESSSENIHKKGRISNLKEVPSVNNLSIIGIQEASSHISNFQENLIGNKESILLCETLDNEISHKDKDQLYLEEDNKIRNDNFHSLNEDKKNKDTHISLTDILDNAALYNINEFRKDENEFLGIQEKKESKQKKNKKRKQKESKCLTLDEFLDDYQQADYQNDCCNDYFRKLSREKNKDGIQIRSTVDFPNLKSDELEFIHGKKLKSEEELITSGVLSGTSEVNGVYTEYVEGATAVSDITDLESTCEKLVIENIPNDVNRDDIHSILCGYGKIRKFSLESIGEFFKVHVEIYLDCDIDLVIEYLDGTEAFGTSTKPLKCYRLQ